MKKICSRKECSHKGKPQPLSNFYKAKITTDGLRYYCKDCDNERRNAFGARKTQHWLRIIIG